MDTLEFFRRVLPDQGFYAAIVINTPAKIPQQRFATSAEELATNCQRLDANNNNTFYALSTFNTKLKRTQENTKLTKALFLDIDCGPDKVNLVDKNGDPAPDKGYATQQLGLQALLDFIIATGMPDPMIVDSGRGLHIYWTLEEALPRNEWQPLADALKATYQIHGFIFDPAVTADSARVLRPVGTHNPKNGKEVRLLRDAPAYSKQTLQNILGSVDIPTMPASVIQGRQPQSALAAAMTTEPSFEPANPVSIYNGCKQVKWAVDNQAIVAEPLWYKLMGIAAHCDNADNVAISWSKNHKDFDRDETLSKLQQWRDQTTGPTTCKKFEEERPKGCDGCKLKNQITTPCHLGIKHAEITIEGDELKELRAAGIDTDLKAPWPFHLSKVGMVQTIDGTEIEICPFDIRPVGYGKDHHLGYETVRFKWKRPHVGWQDLTFRQAYLNDDNREFATTIADQGIVLKGKKQTGSFQFMLRNYMDELRKKRTMSNIYGSMGWKENYTQFVIGERLYKREADGTVSVETISLSAATGNVGQSMYSMAGSAEEWSKASSILETANMPWHIFALNTAFSAPLWTFTGLKGITISLHGGTGGGKSIIQLMSQSVWGDPSKLHFAAKFTHNALFSRLSIYGNLPMTIDEATYMENVGDFCYWVTQGRDKARLSRNAVERQAREWATNVVVSTNVSFAAKMSASGVETDAQMARLLEIDIPLHNIFRKSSNAGSTIADFLMLNHGVTGDALAKEYVRLGEHELRRRIKEAKDQFATLYGCTFHGQERFWETELVLQHVGCTIARGLGLIGYDFRLGITHIVDQIESLRAVVEDTHTTGFTLVTQYLNEIAANTLTVMHTQNMNVAVDANRLPWGEVKAQFDVYRNAAMDKFDRGTVMIVRKNFKEWLAKHGYDYNRFCKELQGAGADATPQSKRFVFGKETQLKAGQHYVVGINLNTIEMLGFLDTIQQSAEDMTLGQMGIVE
jgi:hypothetical protein